MTRIEQKRYDGEYGDCLRAVVASLLDLRLEAVPNFMMSEELYHDVLVAFLWAHGWHHLGTKRGARELRADDSIDGYFIAAVFSGHANGNTHAVVMDLNGIVIHDPFPGSPYQGRKVHGTPELIYWDVCEPRNDGWRDCPHVQKWLERQGKG